MKTLNRILAISALACAQFSVSAKTQTEITISEGVKLFQQKQYTQAEQYFLSKLGTDPIEHHTALVYLSKLSLGFLDSEQAETYIDQALAIEPNLVDELLLAGDINCKRARQVSIFSALGYGKQCIKYYEKAVEHFPGSIKALNTVIQFHMFAPSFAGGDSDKAEDYLTQLSQLSEESARIHQIRFIELEQSKTAAINLANSYADKPYQDSDALYQLALFYKDKELYVNAKRLFNELVERYQLANRKGITSSWFVQDSLLQLGEVYLAENKDIRKAIEYLEAYLKQNNDPFDRNYFWARWSMARAYYDAGLAESYLQQITEISSSNYQKDKEFKDVFEAGLKDRKIGG